MNRLRENTGVVLWILVIAFGLIWVLQDAGTFDVIGTPGSAIMEVDGEEVAYEEFAAALEQRMEAYRQRSGESMSPQMVEAERQRVFEALVEDRLREREIERLGITVTDEEVVDLVLGDNPHPIIKLYFGDGQGNVDRALLQNFISNPDAQAEWIQLEEYLRSERRREKLDNLIAATVRVSEQDVLDEYQRRNKRVSARYVALPYAALPDDSINVTESDLRDYYNENREDYRRERTYQVQYVVRSKNPSPADSSDLMRDLENLKERFQEAENDSTFLARNASARPYADAYFRRDELDNEVAEVVYDNLEEGAVVGPFFAANQVHLVKIQDVREADEPVVRASHILLRAPEGNEEARREARQQLNELKQRIQQGEDFAALARQFSADGTAARGGDLGWFGRGRMVEPFEEAAFDAREGEVVGPVETQFGVHLIKVTDRATQEVRIADYAQDVRASVATLNEQEETLDDLQYYASESGDFAAEVERLGLNAQNVTIEAEQQFIPGLGRSTTIMNFLEDAEEGAISSVVELDNQFVVVHVNEIAEAGYRPFDEVQAELEPRVKLQAKADVQAERLQRAMAQADGLDAAASQAGAQVRPANNLTLANAVVPGLGREPQFVGTAFGLSQGQTSDVVRGENAAYVLEVTSVDEPAPITETMRQQIRDQLLQQRRTQVTQSWITELREEADVRDYRRRFFQ